MSEIADVPENLVAEPDAMPTVEAAAAAHAAAPPAELPRIPAGWLQLGEIRADRDRRTYPLRRGMWPDVITDAAMPARAVLLTDEEQAWFHAAAFTRWWEREPRTDEADALGLRIDETLIFGAHGLGVVAYARVGPSLPTDATDVETAAVISAPGDGKCASSDGCLRMLLSSRSTFEAVEDDLVRGRQTAVWLSSAYTPRVMPRSLEFRLFVDAGALVGVSQRHLDAKFADLIEAAQHISPVVLALGRSLAPAFPLPRGSVDICGLDRDDGTTEFRVLALNGPDAERLLFATAPWEIGTADVEFRFLGGDVIP